MFDARKLRCAVIMVTAAMLTTSCGRTSESEGDGTKMEFVRIPAGTFQMGSPASEEGRNDNEGPVHEVRITKPFYMGKYEVTQAQWKAVMGRTVGQQRDKAGMPWYLKGESPEYPIYNVSWEEAVEFCKRLGKKFRLPTEAEWEYACRAGSQTRFHYGDDPNYLELDQYAWYYGKSDNQTQPVGQKKPNAWGLYDICGNLSEWCCNRYPYSTDYKNAGSFDPTEGGDRDARGGSWLGKPADCRSANRISASWPDSIGFRVVFVGKVRGDNEILRVTLPKRTAKAITASEQDLNNRLADGWMVVGSVRDEAGKLIDDIEMDVLPVNWPIRRYAEGEFEAYGFPDSSETNTSKHRFVARHMQQNLVAITEIVKDTKTLDIRLAPGVILTGQAVDSNGKGVKGAKIVTTLRDSEWHGILASVIMETDDEGKFEMRALPSGYGYGLSARSRGYRIGRIEVRPDDVRDNRVDGISIVLPRGQFSVSGVVVDANGKPVADVQIWCSGADQIGINSRTDADGQFKADGIFTGKVDVMANVRGDDGKWTGGSVIVEAGATDARVVLGTGEWIPPPKGRACFAAKTGVWVDGAVVPISKIARRQAVGQKIAAPFGLVERVDEHQGEFECRDILLDSGNRISVVDGHCFMLDSGMWIAAQNLRNDLKLKTTTGTVGIKSVTVRATPYVGKVYNLKIANSDRYAMGRDGVIVRDY